MAARAFISGTSGLTLTAQEREFLREDGTFDTAKAHPVMRAGYLGDYAEIGPMFDLRRPKA